MPSKDEAVFDTFFDASPFAGLVRDGDTLTDVQPLVAFRLESDAATTAVVEVRTQPPPQAPSLGQPRHPKSPVPPVRWPALCGHRQLCRGRFP